tara:strand:+ start:151 stop:1143 length:993 start_codon:yes stop_codon:yes gene_type:complete
MKLEIYWMRHAISCNNIKKKIQKILHFYKMKDPSILLGAMLTIIEMKKFLPKKMRDCKLVLCSEMKRTMQTAILNYPEHFINGKIKIIKGVNEHSRTFDIARGNIPQKILILKKELKFSILFLHKFIKESDNKKYKEYKLYNYLNNCKNIEKTLDKLIDNLFSDINNKHFDNLVKLREDENNIVNSLFNYLKPKNISKIVIISHSNFISKNIFKNKDDFLHLIRTNEKKLYNNQILHKKYTKLNSNNNIKFTEKIYPYGCMYKNNEITCFHNYNMLDKYAYKTNTKKKYIKKNKKNKKITHTIKFNNNKSICSNKKHISKKMNKTLNIKH